jgi:peptidyl-prolyl cis-trans isomerase B (cyclophilin B)
MRSLCVVLLVAVVLVPSGLAQRQTPPAPAASANPVIVVETAKGTFEIELFKSEAPKSVAHILQLVSDNFYRGLRFSRAEPGLVQVGDPQSRDVSKEAYWGSGNSGNPIGVAEISKTRKHERGTVALAHSGYPQSADSQFYIMKVASPSLDGKYAIIGKVTTPAGMAVVDKIVKKDAVLSIKLKGAGR